MLFDAIAELTVIDEETGLRKVLDFIGTPVVALLVAVLVLPCSPSVRPSA